MQKKDIIIIVPIYKKEMNITEQISYDRLYEVLGGYDIVFIAPKRMEKFCDKNRYDAVFFDDRFFESTATYSELLVSDFFYSEFANYEYMLIYQLDAYVFRDELLDFCQLGYDYIGAPVPRELGAWGTVRARVGNGGLSLRKISSVRRILADMSKICAESGFEDLFYNHEDLFFGYCGARSNIEFSVPDVKVALSFAVDEDVCHIFKRMNDGLVELPFGCHGWSRKVVYYAWRKFIAKNKDIQVKLDDYFSKVSGPSYQKVRWYRLSEYILSRFKKYNKTRLVDLCNRYLDPRQLYIIWGYGEYGTILHKLLKACGYRISRIFDSKPKDNLLDDVPITVPDWNYIKTINSSIVITPIYYEEEIKKQLLVNDIADRRIVVYSSLLMPIIVDYVNSLLGVEERVGHRK